MKLVSALLSSFLFACAAAPVQSSDKPLVPERSTAPAPKKEAPEQDPPGPRAVAQSFSVPIPNGFEQYRDDAHEVFYSDGGVILSNGLQASILIAALPNKGLDLSDSVLCFALSEDVAKSLSGEVAGVRKVERPKGPTCQVLVKGEQDKLSRAEVVGGVDQIWMVTCNYDARDKATPASCDQVVDGFSPIKRPAVAARL